MRYIPVLIELALLIYALIDILGTHSSRVRNLPKFLWVILVILVPYLGPLAWIVGGRPGRGQQPAVEGTWPVRLVPSEPSRDRPTGPEDDPAFMEQLRRNQDDHERMLKQWEEDLRRREQDLRDEPGPDSDGTESRPSN